MCEVVVYPSFDVQKDYFIKTILNGNSRVADILFQIPFSFEPSYNMWKENWILSLFCGWAERDTYGTRTNQFYLDLYMEVMKARSRIKFLNSLNQNKSC